MLHTIKPARGSRRPRKRVGRGSGSGQGTTAGRGTKGQQARAGKGRRLGFEGGQVPLIRRLPKLGGFHPKRRVAYEAINLQDLEERLEAGSFDSASLHARKLARTKRPIKILGKGTVTKKFILTVDAVSAAAKEAIEKAGGECQHSIE